MSTIVYGPQLKDLVLAELSFTEEKTAEDIQKALPDRHVTHIATALWTLGSANCAVHASEGNSKIRWRRI